MTRTQVINRAVEAQVASFEGADLEPIQNELDFNFDAIETDWELDLYEQDRYEWDVSFEDIKKMPREERNALRGKVEAILLGMSPADGRWEAAYEVYSDIRCLEDNEYYEANIDAFRAYEAKMGEPDFDWDFYSDWHKDMFGFRPR